MPAYPDLSPDFGHWFAGFADGEGCFWIADRGYCRCGFQIALRLDDKPILDEIQQRTGVGRISIQNSPSLRARGSSTQAVWRVGARSELARLVELFDTFPLRAKKRRDYLIWREAVLYCLSLPKGARKARGGPGGFVPHDWEPVVALAAKLKAARHHNDPLPIETATTPLPPPSLFGADSMSSALG